MGFLDRTIEKTKASVSNTKSKYNEGKDARMVQNQINAEKDKVKELYMRIGQEYYRQTVDGDESHSKNFDELVDQINGCRQRIEELNAQLDDVRAKGKEERENLKAEHEARLQEIEAADEQTKLEKDKSVKEEDLF